MNRTILMVIISALSLAPPLIAQGQAEEQRLGGVHFPVSCTATAQQQFDRALAMLHSFAYPQDLKAFADISETDPNCAMAYWGVAMSRRANPLVSAPSLAVLTDGLAAVNHAKALGANTQRERDYVAAIGHYYQDWETVDYATRVLAYEKAMEQVYRDYPDDSEAAVFYALAINEAITVLPADSNFTMQLEAGRILEKVLITQPEHPGALHYLIHTYDFPGLADRGLIAAQKYGDVASASPHALHMPSHTYSMLGMWQESIKANQAALAVAEDYAHALDFMVYAYLQGAQDNEAKRGVERSIELRKKQTAPSINPTGAVLAGYTALAAIPARFVIERGAWAEAAALQIEPTTPVADSLTYFARAMGSARTGDRRSAQENIDHLTQIAAGLAQAKDNYWAQQVDILRSASAAWVTYGQGRKVAALRQMRVAADLEDGSEKHVAMENRLWPMRELFGDMLLAANKPALALKEYELSLQSARNRYRGIYGAAKAAQFSGDRAKARSYYDKLLALCSNFDTERSELLEARRYLTLQ